MGPYAYKDRQWVGFDDVDTIRRKSEFVREKGLGGGMVWALDLDDFNNRCGQGRHPLMNTIKAVLGPAKGQYSPTRRKEESLSTTGTSETAPEAPESGTASDTKIPLQVSETVPFGEIDVAQEEVITPQVAPVVFREEDNFRTPILEEKPALLEEAEGSTSAEEDEEKFRTPEVTGGKKAVCYFTNWAWYRPGVGKYKPENIKSDLCTHIVYGFAVLDPGTLTIRAHDSWADFDNKFYEQVDLIDDNTLSSSSSLGDCLEIKEQEGALGSGWMEWLCREQVQQTGQQSNKQTEACISLIKNINIILGVIWSFVKHALEFLTEHNFDGPDLDWEYPKCWQVCILSIETIVLIFKFVKVDCSKGPASDKQAFSAWIKELHIAFKPSGLLLTAAVSPSNKVMDEGYEMPELDKYYDGHDGYITNTDVC